MLVANTQIRFQGDRYIHGRFARFALYAPFYYLRLDPPDVSSVQNYRLVEPASSFRGIKVETKETESRRMEVRESSKNRP